MVRVEATDAVTRLVAEGTAGAADALTIGSATGTLEVAVGRLGNGAA